MGLLNRAGAESDRMATERPLRTVHTLGFVCSPILAPRSMVLMCNLISAPH